MMVPFMFSRFRPAARRRKVRTNWWWGYPTAASARGLDGFEAMAKAWADEWQKEMKKEIHKEQMQYQRQLEKEIGVKPPISRQDKRKRNNAGTAGIPIRG